MLFLNKLKKYYYLGILFLVLLPSIVLGQSSVGSPGGQPGSSGIPGAQPSSSGTPGNYIFPNPIGANNLYDFINMFINAIIQIGFIFVVLAVIYSGFLFVKARGNPEELAKAKKAFLWTVIGGVILLGAQALSGVICSTVQQFNPNLQC